MRSRQGRVGSGTEGGGWFASHSFLEPPKSEKTGLKNLT